MVIEFLLKELLLGFAEEDFIVESYIGLRGSLKFYKSLSSCFLFEVEDRVSSSLRFYNGLIAGSSMKLSELNLSLGKFSFLGDKSGFKLFELSLVIIDIEEDLFYFS